MTKNVKLIAIGGSFGIVIPDEILERMRLQPGDTLALEELSDVLELRVAGSEFDRQMAIAREVMRRNRNVLSALAK